MKAAACDGDAAQILVADTAAFDSDLEDSPPQFVGEQGHSRKIQTSLRCCVLCESFEMEWPFPLHRITGNGVAN